MKTTTLVPSRQLLLRKTLAEDIDNFISSAAEEGEETIPDFILEHHGQEVIAVHLANETI